MTKKSPHKPLKNKKLIAYLWSMLGNQFILWEPDKYKERVKHLFCPFSKYIVHKRKFLFIELFPFKEKEWQK